MDDTNDTSSYTGFDKVKQSGGGMDYASSRDLKDPEEMYNVGTAGFAPAGTTIIPDRQPDMKNSGTDLNQPASEANLSAKYKYPNVHQNTSEMPSDNDEPSI